MVPVAVPCLPGELDPAGAAGLGWFVDAIPEEDAEYREVDGELRAEGGEPEGRMDLLSVIEHEIGHVLGLGHSEGERAPDLMANVLPSGVRRLPSADEIDWLLLPGYQAII